MGGYLVLAAIGPDRPGSVDESVAASPPGDAPLFNMKCMIGIPVSKKLSVTRKELDKLGDISILEPKQWNLTK